MFIGQTVPSPSRLTLFENRIYWSDGTKQGIMSIDKYQGHNSIQAVYRKREVREPKGLKAVHKLVQTEGKKLIFIYLFIFKSICHQYFEHI